MKCVNANRIVEIDQRSFASQGRLTIIGSD